MKNWALTFMLNHESANVKNIYYASVYFELEGLINPASAEAYTEREIAEIKKNASEDNDNYVFDVKEGALIGMQAYNSLKTFWYDMENGRKIVSSAAPLLLDGETGELKNTDGEQVAAAF